MGNKHVDPNFQELLDNLSRPGRYTRQQHIEDSIMDFKPDAEEAMEILDAITAAFERRYEKSSDVDHYAKYLKAAFERVAQGLVLNEPDEMDLSRDWRARKAGL